MIRDLDGAPAPANQRSVRRHNLGVVLRHLAAHGPRSRATVAAETGLNKTTVSSLVAELIERRLIVEAGSEERGSVGRPGQTIRLSGDGVFALGLEINVDYLAVRAVDLSGVVRHHELVVADNRERPADETVGALADLAGMALRSAREAGLEPVGATIALPGLVDSARGRLLLAPNLGWTELPIARMLRDHLGDAGPALPVGVENEANLGALAELWDGAGRRFSDFIYVSGEVGVGAGIVVGGELFRGAQGFGGEFGHLTIDPDGRPCACGSRGCLETLIGLEALLTAAGQAPADGLRAGQAPPGALLAERARVGDEATLAALASAGRWLGIGLSAAANLLSPQGVVLGGYLGDLAEWLVRPVAAELRHRVISAGWSAPEVVVSALGSEAAVRGAAALSLRDVLADPGGVLTPARPAE